MCMFNLRIIARGLAYIYFVCMFHAWPDSVLSFIYSYTLLKDYTMFSYFFGNNPTLLAKIKDGVRNKIEGILQTLKLAGGLM